jgi:hypothetical protein
LCLEAAAETVALGIISPCFNHRLMMAQMIHRAENWPDTVV